MASPNFKTRIGKTRLWRYIVATFFLDSHLLHSLKHTYPVHDILNSILPNKISISIKSITYFHLNVYNLHYILHFYRPQRSCSKVMFLLLSISHSVHRGVYSSMQWGRHPPGQTYPSMQWGRHPPGQTPLRQTPPWTDTPTGQTATAADGTHPTRMHSCI